MKESKLFRTIHKAKGDEFNHVMVVMDTDENGHFDEAKELSFLLRPDLSWDEKQRIKNVGISWARDHLFISLPSLSPTNKTTLEGKGLKNLS